MANKKVSQLTSKPSVLVTDLFPIADPTTGQLFKTTISALGTAIGSGVSSVNTLVGAVVLDTDDIQELASPTNRWYTDTRSRAALSASSPLVYNSGTGAFSIPAATTSVNGYLTSTDWTTFNAKQAALSGTGFVKISGTTISYDNSTYLTTSAAASTYLALAGGTLTGALNGTSANFSGDLTLTGTNPRIYLTDSDNNPDYFISNTDGTFTVYDVTNSTSRFTIGTTGNGTFGGNLTVGQIIRSGGTSSQFLKADGSVDSSTYVKGSGTATYLASWTATANTLTDSFISFASNITSVEGMGLSSLNGIEINGNYGGGAGGLKIKSYDETTGKAYINFINDGGVFRLGIEGSTGGGILPGSTAYATILTSGLTAKNLEFGTNNAKRLTLDGTTGAATFTSTISATGATLTGALSGTSATFSGQLHIPNNSTGTLGGLYFDYNANAASRTWQIVSDYDAYGDFQIRQSTTQTGSTYSKILGFSPTGAATFSSSVTSEGLFKSNQGIFQVFAAGTFRGGLYNYASASGSGTDYSVTLNSETNLYFTTAGSATQKMTITSAGSVGIGTTAPSSYGNLTVVMPNNSNGTGLVIKAINDGGTASQPALTFLNGSSAIISQIIADNGTGFMAFNMGATERMRITTAGALLVGATSIFASGLVCSDGGTTYTPFAARVGTTSNAGQMYFLNPNGIVGSITTNGSVTSFNITSDYRLKEDLKPIKGLEIVNKIKVYDYKWKSDDSRMDGVLAHELVEVLPYAVTGVKDGEQMQSVDYSKIVPVMVQAIKDLKQELDSLKNK